MKLQRDFYQKNAITLGKELLGKYLVHVVRNEKLVARIVETESYVGPEDKACHAYNNKKTARTEIMFEEGGYAYIYLIYGMYYCLNIVAHGRNKPEAVLIRAVEPVQGLEIMKKNRNIKSKKIEDLTNGPGKLCIAFNIDKSLNKIDMASSNNIYVEDHKEDFEIIASKRINIDYAEEYKDKLWRFYIKNNAFVSK